MNEHQLRNEIAKKIRTIDLSEFTIKPRNSDISKNLNKLRNEVLAIVLDVDICELCERIELECDCVFCKICGRKEYYDAIFEGKCGACEDAQMIRGIK